MIIREANLKDLSNIAKLHAQSWRENYAEVLSEDYLNEKVLADRVEVWTDRLTHPKINQLVLVVENERAFSGFICAYGAHHPNYGTIIDNLHIAPDFKGRGFGTKLIANVASWAATNFKEADLYLEVLECNTKARGFYESIGAKNIKTAYWHTPCGNQAKEFIYSWDSLYGLIQGV